jgi:hypothetical protein
VSDLNDYRRQLEQQRIKEEVRKALAQTPALSRAVAEVEEYYRNLPKRGERDELR